jgi:hypothetical protein
MSLLLDLEEVRALVRGPDHGGLTGHAISDRLRVADRVPAALIKHGHLKSITVINPSIAARPWSCLSGKLSGLNGNSSPCSHSPSSGDGISWRSRRNSMTPRWSPCSILGKSVRRSIGERRS